MKTTWQQHWLWVVLLGWCLVNVNTDDTEEDDPLGVASGFNVAENEEESMGKIVVGESRNLDDKAFQNYTGNSTDETSAAWSSRGSELEDGTFASETIGTTFAVKETRISGGYGETNQNTTGNVEQTEVDGVLVLGQSIDTTHEKSDKLITSTKDNSSSVWRHKEAGGGMSVGETSNLSNVTLTTFNGTEFNGTATIRRLSNEEESNTSAIAASEVNSTVTYISGTLADNSSTKWGSIFLDGNANAGKLVGVVEQNYTDASRGNDNSTFHSWQTEHVSGASSTGYTLEKGKTRLESSADAYNGNHTSDWATEGMDGSMSVGKGTNHRISYINNSTGDERLNSTENLVEKEADGAVKKEETQTSTKIMTTQQTGGVYEGRTLKLANLTIFQPGQRFSHGLLQGMQPEMFVGRSAVPGAQLPGKLRLATPHEPQAPIVLPNKPLTFEGK